MKLYFMKQSAIDYLKANIKTLYMNYYRYATNEWIYDLFDYDPFEFFMEIPDFHLAPIGDVMGETDVENCKRMYSNLQRLSESQAADERLWAGLCHDAFYPYIRLRWKYGTMRQKKVDTDVSAILSRFYFLNISSKYRNTLARYWWVGRLTYCSDSPDHWQYLDKIGPEDFSTKLSDIFYSNTFAANPELLHGICEALDFFRIRGQKVLMRDHLRPALQYLNALGGGILLDALSEEDISSIMIEIIGKLRNGEQGDFMNNAGIGADNEPIDADVVEDDDLAPDVNIDYQEEQEALEQQVEAVDVESVLGAPETVERGHTVWVELQSSHKMRRYDIPLTDDDRRLYGIEQQMLGKHVGDRVQVRLETYEIKEILWGHE